MKQVSIVVPVYNEEESLKPLYEKLKALEGFVWEAILVNDGSQDKSLVTLKELAQKEEKEIEILEKYLPEQMSDEDAENRIKKVIEEVGAETKADMGKVMGVVMGKLGSQVDGGKVKEIVEKLLS